VAELSDVGGSGRERQRRMNTQTIATMIGDPLAQNVHVGKSANHVDRIKR